MLNKGLLMLTIGDSTTWSMATNGKNLYSYLVYQEICNNYKQIKYVNKGIGGSTSTDLVKNLGHYSGLFEPDLLLIGVGMNDANSAVSDTTTYKNNLRTLIDWYRRKNPTVYIILVTQNTIDVTVGTRTYVQNFRDAMQSIATEKNCQCAHFENSWDTSQLATYCNSDKLHPNDAGHSKFFNDTLKSMIDAWIATKP
jgi:lysophospholipase L1-like esterase